MRAGRKGLSQSDTTPLHASEASSRATHFTAGLPVRVMTALPAASYSSAVTAIHRALGRLTSQCRATPRGLLGGTWVASVSTPERLPCPPALQAQRPCSRSPTSDRPRLDPDGCTADRRHSGGASRPGCVARVGDTLLAPAVRTVSGADDGHRSGGGPRTGNVVTSAARAGRAAARRQLSRVHHGRRDEHLPRSAALVASRGRHGGASSVVARAGDAVGRRRHRRSRGCHPRHADARARGSARTGDRH
jgi:hypothetical protein